jgi:anti-anti-sigma regulatory factor
MFDRSVRDDGIVQITIKPRRIERLEEMTSFREKLNRLAKEGPQNTRMIIDMHRVDYLNVLCVQDLAGIAQDMLDAGGAMVLCCVMPQIAALLESSPDSVGLRISVDADHAARTFRPIPLTQPTEAAFAAS